MSHTHSHTNTLTRVLKLYLIFTFLSKNRSFSDIYTITFEQILHAAIFLVFRFAQLLQGLQNLDLSASSHVSNRQCVIIHSCLFFSYFTWISRHSRLVKLSGTLPRTETLLNTMHEGNCSSVTARYITCRFRWNLKSHRTACTDRVHDFFAT